LPKSRFFVLSGMLVLSVCSAIGWSARQSANAGQARPSALPVPVSVARATLKDVPIYLTGLGTVQASQTVAIHPQVEGVLEDVLFTEGQQVKKGDVLARIEPRLFVAALDQAKAKKAQDSALRVAAEKDLNRFTALGLRNIVSRQDVEQQQAKFDQLNASIAADDAAMETAQAQLDYSTIRAPSDGRVGIRLIDRGNLVRTSDAGAITTLVVTRPSAVLFTLPSNDLDDVRAAMSRGSVEVIAWDQDNQRILSRGRLLLIDNSIDASTATIRLKAMFANTDDRLWPGEFVNARVLIETRRSVVTIPAYAVQRGPQGLFAWVISANQTAQPKPIQVGLTTDNLTIVTGGLTEGQTVVTDGQYKLQPGAVVTTGPPTQPSTKGAK
jgi:membrane fusion protein, multidrug efflux system